ncbi:MAG: tRNA lysidine(34) synthetase TilS [Candidatus Omnitrophica bacterium]|nr:tRNA lysidine(34) synthetase TilS [Candidatus Omnitrophota bacterium]
MLKKVKNTADKFRLLKKNDRIVVGVSGGPDSTALLYALRSLGKRLKLKLLVAHLDHGLRKDSAQDARFVRDLALKLRLPLISGKTLVKKSGSMEESARKARFDFLLKAAKKFKTDKIALGHNLDDQAETVLMRILRGTGLNGLNAILPKRAILGCEIIRPLIEVKRKEIEAYLKRNKVVPRRDLTNAQDIYLRNKIRNRLLPLLEKDYNVNIKSILANLAESSGVDYEYLDIAACRAGRGSATRLNMVRLKKDHPALRRLLFRRAIKHLQGDTRRITFQHIKEIEDLLFSRPVNSVVNLPKGVSVSKRKSRLIFSRKSQ